MDLLSLALVIVAIGVLLWLANSFIPMEGTVKKILNGVVIIGLVLWIFSLFFNIPNIHIGR